ncbi:Uncharacterised protein [Chlamydia trachomatis]|nr:Uncharacterised protein [Chlamydia trachomatis]
MRGGRRIALVAGVVRARQVTPRADHLNKTLVAGHPHCRSECRQIRERRTRTRHARIDLHVNARLLTSFACSRADLGQHPGPRHRQIQVCFECLCPVSSRGGNPGQNRRFLTCYSSFVERVSQSECFTELRDTEPRGSCLKRSHRNGKNSMPVGVCLDNCHLNGRRRRLFQHRQIVGNGAEVNDSARRVLGESGRFFVHHASSIAPVNKRALRRGFIVAPPFRFARLPPRLFTKPTALVHRLLVKQHCACSRKQLVRTNLLKRSAEQAQ